MGGLFQLAPMAELSHRALRELIDGFGGCDEYYTEMISSSALLAGGPFEKWYMDPLPRPEKLVFQLVGADSSQIARAAAVLDQIGSLGIDINMGCSAPAIRKAGCGAAWMADIDHAGQLIAAVRPQVKGRLSVKLRIGQKNDLEYLVKFCRRLEEEGAEMIILHPRTISEKFKRLSRWEYVRALKRELRIPVSGNGDISNASELRRRAGLNPQGSVSDSMTASGGDSAHIDCPVDELIPDASLFPDAVMVGRAAVRQPWIFAQARGIEPNASIEETGLKFLDMLTLYQPREFHISRARRFFSFFCDNLKWGNYLKNLINREETIPGIEKVWQTYFRENL